MIRIITLFLFFFITFTYPAEEISTQENRQPRRRSFLSQFLNLFENQSKNRENQPFVFSFQPSIHFLGISGQYQLSKRFSLGIELEKNGILNQSNLETFSIIYPDNVSQGKQGDKYYYYSNGKSQFAYASYNTIKIDYSVSTNFKYFPFDTFPLFIGAKLKRNLFGSHQKIQQLLMAECNFLFNCEIAKGEISPSPNLTTTITIPVQIQPMVGVGFQIFTISGINLSLEIYERLTPFYRRVYTYQDERGLLQPERGLTLEEFLLTKVLIEKRANSYNKTEKHGWIGWNIKF